MYGTLGHFTIYYQSAMVLLVKPNHCLTYEGSKIPSIREWHIACNVRGHVGQFQTRIMMVNGLMYLPNSLAGVLWMVGAPKKRGPHAVLRIQMQNDTSCMGPDRLCIAVCRNGLCKQSKYCKTHEGILFISR